MFKSQRSKQENRDKRENNAALAIGMLNKKVLPCNMARVKNRLLLEYARYVPIKHQEAIVNNAVILFGGKKGGETGVKERP